MSFDRYEWEYPELEEWEDSMENRNRAVCNPYACYPASNCHPRSCSPRSCSPNYVCYPSR